MNIETSIELLYLVCKHGSSHQIREVLTKTRETYGDLFDSLFPVIALEVIEWFTVRSKLSQLYQFSVIIEEEGFLVEAEIGLREIGSRSQDDELRYLARKKQETIQTLETSIGLPEWYVRDPTCNQGLYRELAQDSEYQCFRYKSEREGREGTLEIISLDRILQAGFHDAEDWENYLRRLHNTGWISLIQVALYVEDGSKVFCLYEIPKGMRSLADCLLHENAKELFSPTAVLNIAISIVEILIQSKYNRFNIEAIDPLNILWNPIGQSQDIMLLNIGASLGFPRYQCSQPSCSVPISDPEIGKTKATYYVGLLLLQLLIGQCSLEAIGSTQSRYNRRQSLFDLLQMPNTSPQFRSIIGRLLSSTPEYRYSELNSLKQDLLRTQQFLNALPDKRYLDGRDDKNWFTLLEFTAFRLQVISRNPDVRSLPPIPKAEAILRTLSNDLAYLPDHLRALWDTKIQYHHKLSTFPSSWRVKDLSPEGKRLLGVAEGWETASNQIRKNQTSLLTKLCLYRILSIEASACVMSLIVRNESLSDEFLERMNSAAFAVLGSICDQSCVKIRVSVQVSPNEPHISCSLNLNNYDIEQLQDFVSWFRNDGKSNYGRRPISLKAIVLFLLMFEFRTRIYLKKDEFIDSVPITVSKSSNIGREVIWQLLKYLEEIEHEIEQLDKYISAVGEGSASNGWYYWFDLVNAIQRVRVSDRKPAKIHYSQSNYRAEGEGLAKLVFPSRGTLSFESNEVFLSGNVLKVSESFRPAKVDVYGEQKDRKLSAVHAPTALFAHLPYPDRVLAPASIARWIKNHKAVFAISVVATLFGLFSSLGILISPISEITNVILVSGFISAFGGLASNLYAGAIQSYLETRFPEDST